MATDTADIRQYHTWGENGNKPDFGYPYNSKDGREMIGVSDAIYRLLRGKIGVSEAMRVVRGGSWLDSGWHARCAVRYRLMPADLYSGSGFRVVSPGF